MMNHFKKLFKQRSQATFMDLQSSDSLFSGKGMSPEERAVKLRELKAMGKFLGVE